jgi:PAS domain-containing protein
MSVNPAFCSVFRTSTAQAEGRLIGDLDGAEWSDSRLKDLLLKVLPNDGQFENYEMLVAPPGQKERRFRLNARRIAGSDSRPALILLAFEDADSG